MTSSRHVLLSWPKQELLMLVFAWGFPKDTEGKFFM